MTEVEIKEKVIDVVDGMSVDEKMKLWLEYMGNVVADNYRFDISSKRDYQLKSVHYPILGVYVGKYPNQDDKRYHRKPSSFEDFISEECKKKENYLTGDFYHLTGIYYHFRKKVEERERKQALFKRQIDSMYRLQVQIQNIARTIIGIPNEEAP